MGSARFHVSVGQLSQRQFTHRASVSAKVTIDARCKLHSRASSSQSKCLWNDRGRVQHQRQVPTLMLCQLRVQWCTPSNVHINCRHCHETFLRGEQQAHVYTASAEPVDVRGSEPPHWFTHKLVCNQDVDLVTKLLTNILHLISWSVCDALLTGNCAPAQIDDEHG